MSGSRLVIDADAAIRVAEHDGYARLGARFALAAPRIMWAESCSALHRQMRRRGVVDGLERVFHDRIASAAIEPVDGYERRTPWDIADMLGWHKTYDAEYLAAARHLRAGIFSLDKQLLDGARRLGIPIVAPE